MGRILVIGAGDASTVAAKKIAMNVDVFADIMVASRTKSKCDKTIADIKNIKVQTAQVGADNAQELAALFNTFKLGLVVNLILPYQDLHIMDACLEHGVSCLDMANHEPLDEARYQYSQQWTYKGRFEKADLTAILGCGFDPGVTGIYTAYVARYHFDEIHYLDIVNYSAGNHRKAFVTSFNPETNIREITQHGRYFEGGEWKETDPSSIHKALNYPNAGPKESYLIYHRELEGLTKNFPALKRARFWMTSGQEYLIHLRTIQNTGMARIDPILYNGQEIVPIQFLRAVLPNPGDLGKSYTGKTSIDCRIHGIRDGKELTCYVCNNCSHHAAYLETGARGVSYAAGIPAIIGVKLFTQGIWKKPGIWNVEELNPDPLMRELDE